MNLLALFLFNFAFAQSTFDGLQTGRYEIHRAEKESVKKDSDSKKPTISKISQSKVNQTSAERNVANQEQAVAVEPSLENLSNQSEENNKVTVKEEPGIVEQVQSLASGGTDKVYDFYREQIHPDDNRNNRVEIEISPGLASSESTSNYSYREYRSYFHVMSFRSNVWFTPLIGVSGRYAFSFGADTSGDSATHSRESVNFEYLDLSVNFRKFFGLSRKADSVEFDLLYSDNKMKVPSDSTSRGRVGSVGLGVGFKYRLPSSIHYAWTFGGSFFPKIQHSEGATALQLNSGSGVESSRVGLDLGGELKMNRESQIIWNLALSSEKNLFKGTASVVDTSTGTTPKNVSVTNSLLMFNLGYRWGQ